MNLGSILLSKCLRAFKGGGHDVRASMYLPTLSKVFQERYGFFQGPRTVEEFDLQKGVVYLHGQFDGFVIDQCTVYAEGVGCEGRVGTEDLDRFVDDAVKWVHEIAKVPPSVELGRGYESRLEVSMDVAINHTFDRFAEFGRSVTASVRRGNRPSPDFELSGLIFHGDPILVGGQRPLPFTIERRAGKPYGDNVYFSEAALSTGDHLRHLAELEVLLKG